MTKEEFDQTMRSFVKRTPFEPFVVELLGGERFIIPFPEVAFGRGAAGYINEKGVLVGMKHDEVRSIHAQKSANGSSGGEWQAMTEEEFDQTMRSFVKRRPFVPFVVELLDGRKIIVRNRHVAFGGGAAGFLSRKEGLVGFSNEEVKSFSPPVSS